MIANSKKTVIFAMEEPEIAIPPATQKRIVGGVRSRSSQALFTSHSPYVLEEFHPSEIMCLQRDSAGKLAGTPIVFPAHIKPKAYSSEFRLRFAEALLARRILIAEGDTEAAAYPAAARRLAELDPQAYASLEALGIAVFNARTDSQVAGYGAFFKSLGKTVYAVFDKQADAAKLAAIKGSVDLAFEAPSKGFEGLLLTATAEAALRRFAAMLVSDGEWPGHLAAQTPQTATPLANLRAALQKYFIWAKGSGGAADLLSVCNVAEMPATVKTALAAIKLAATLPLTPGAASAGRRAAQALGGQGCPSLKCASSERRSWSRPETFSCWVGPGSGKTTIALVKAASEVERDALAAGQRILFLSFARATVARIMQEVKVRVPKTARNALEINTYHGFAWSFIQAHGYLLTGHRMLRLLPPPDAAARLAGISSEGRARRFRSSSPRRRHSVSISLPDWLQICWSNFMFMSLYFVPVTSRIARSSSARSTACATSRRSFPAA